jgi:hypothetical protein
MFLLLAPQNLCWFFYLGFSFTFRFPYKFKHTFQFYNLATSYFLSRYFFICVYTLIIQTLFPPTMCLLAFQNLILFKWITNQMQPFSNLLSWRLFTAQHVSGVLPPIIMSSITAMAATAVIEFLIMSGRKSKTRWAVNKLQDNKLKNCCIWLVIYLNCTMMHGLANPNLILFSLCRGHLPCTAILSAPLRLQTPNLNHAIPFL